MTRYLRPSLLHVFTGNNPILDVVELVMRPMNLLIKSELVMRPMNPLIKSELVMRPMNPLIKSG